MIDWKKVAEEYELTPSEFEREIFTTAACLGAMRIDLRSSSDEIRFTTNDDISQLELNVKRVLC